jgi:hypothetical protein
LKTTRIDSAGPFGAQRRRKNLSRTNPTTAVFTACDLGATTHEVEKVTKTLKRLISVACAWAALTPFAAQAANAGAYEAYAKGAVE